MKVSKEKQSQIRSELIDAAVALFSEKGIEQTTMRAIAKAAGYSTATAYNYFANREMIFYAFFDDRAQKTLAALKVIPDFASFNLKEKLQAHIETTLDIYLEDREFVIDANKRMFASPLKMFNELEQARSINIDFVSSVLAEAIEKGELPQIPITDFMLNLYWDYVVLMILYWLNDDSPQFAKSSELIDMSLDLVLDFFKSNMLHKFSEIAVFLLKSHFQRSLGNLDSLFDKVASLGRKFEKK